MVFNEAHEEARQKVDKDVLIKLEQIRAQRRLRFYQEYADQQLSRIINSYLEKESAENISSINEGTSQEPFVGLDGEDYTDITDIDA